MGGMILDFKNVKVKLGTMDNAVLFMKICNKYHNVNIDYSVIGSRYVVDAKSIIGILSTSVEKEAEVIIHTNSEHIIEKFLHDIEQWIIE